MEDIVDASAPIHSIARKRKADQQECQDTSSNVDNVEQPILLDPAATPRIQPETAEQRATEPWLLSPPRQPLSTSWQNSPPVLASFLPSSRPEGPSKPKRPRIEIPYSTPSSPRRRFRRGRAPYTLSFPSPRRLIRQSSPNELQRTGIASATDPRPSRLHLPLSNLPALHRPCQSAPVSPVDQISPHIPSQQPPINRETLKELDLEAILRNPQLRHDLLFDSGLQFRPTSSRRKRDVADNYWLAVVRELETACTCVTLDAAGRLQECICICDSVPLPLQIPIKAASSSGNFITVRTPSRLKPLLSELLQVLVSIIQPVVYRPSGFNMPPTLLQPQITQNVSHVAHLRSILDVDFIHQEIQHGLFDPSGVFQEIGNVVRCYCAPMRDPLVDQMVKLAQSCSPGGTGTKSDAVRAIRLCFEIMELMKLDVANHQLQTLRPYLVNSAAQFELKMFQESRQKGQFSLNVTQQWLQSAFADLPDSTNASQSSMALPRNVPKPSRLTKIQMAITKGMVGLIFDPPSLPSSTPSSPVMSPESSPYRSSQPSTPAYPETLYLDLARSASLSSDAADLTTLYMLLLFYRQLVLSGSSQNDGPKNVVKLDDLLNLKKEIWEIGPPRLGYCFASNTRKGMDTAVASDRSEYKENKHAKELARWREGINDVVLQLTRRATDARSKPNIPFSLLSSPPSSVGDSQPSSTIRSLDPSLLSLATRWTESNLQPSSALSILMRKRICAAVEEVALQMVVPSLKKTSSLGGDSGEPATSVSCGLEPLMPEITNLAERISKLVSIHMNVYGALYAQPGFLSD